MQTLRRSTQFATLLLLAGCAARPARIVQVVDAPATQPSSPGMPASQPVPVWPREWNGRKLFESRHALIYARHARDAVEIEEIITAAQSRLPPDSSTQARGLAFVSGADDQPLLHDEQALMRLSAESRMAEWSAAQARATSAKMGAATQPAASQPASRPWSERRAELISKGLPVSLMLMSMSFDIRRAALVDRTNGNAGQVLRAESAEHRVAARSGAHPPPNPTDPCWAVALPTRKLCRTFISDTMDVAMKQPEVTLAQRIVAAPFLPMIQSVAVNELAAQRQTAVLLAMIQGQPDWTDAQKESQLQIVRDAADRDQAVRLKSFEEQAARKAAASRPASTQPIAE